MKLRPLLALCLLLSICSSYGGERSVVVNLRSHFYHIKRKLITNPTELESLGLFGTDFHSQEYLDEMLSSFWEGIEFNNYYLVFYKSYKESYRKISQIRSQKLILKGYIRVSKSKARCSTYQSLNHTVIKHGLGLTSALKGICGEIATIYSLEELGLIQNIFKGKFIKEKLISQILPKAKRVNGGMSLHQVAQAHKSYTKKNCKIYRQVCERDMKNISPRSQELFKKLTKRNLKVFVAKLYKYINSSKPKYACSLGMISYDSRKKKKLSHIEYITKIALNPNSKKAIIITKNGMVQGNMTNKIPGNPGSNTFSIDPENLKCTFESSSNRAINSIYKGASLERIEAICCSL